MEESVMMMKKQNIFRDVNMELTGEDIAMLSPPVGVCRGCCL